jgi:hypothetical protein
VALAQAVSLAQTDLVAQLSRRIETGQAHVRFDEKRGYLPWLLEALDIPPESQMLVFSKTSVQSIQIGPNNPRMLFFNDSVILGSVKGGPVELAAQDSDRGMIFYLVDQTPFRYRELMAKPEPASPFSRRTDCMSCHLSKSTGIPETLVRSVVPSLNGTPLIQFPAHDTDDRTPFDKLWGGWYVTGKSEARHMGNTVMDERGKVTPLDPPGSSDIVALMVFEHQMHMMNLIAQARTIGRIDELVDYMLFVDEAPLPGKVGGSSEFAAKFMARGPRDSKGRSLRDLDLSHRLMRYPCSYMIYAEAFDALPAQTKGAVYLRMWRILSGEATGVRYRRFSLSDREAVVEILRDTKKDLPDYYRRMSP